jgi:hypothetical protein
MKQKRKNFCYNEAKAEFKLNWTRQHRNPGAGKFLAPGDAQHLPFLKAGSQNSESCQKIVYTNGIK